jgi:hypothetical protein
MPADLNKLERLADQVDDVLAATVQTELTAERFADIGTTIAIVLSRELARNRCDERMALFMLDTVTRTVVGMVGSVEMSAFRPPTSFG